MESHQRLRTGTYAFISLGLIVLQFMPVRADHRSTPSFHTLAESIATCLALLTGTIALLRYYTRKNHAYLYLGTGFIGAGLLGIYHTVATSALVGPLMILPSPARHAASWLVMRTYLAVMLLLGCLLSGDEEESVSKGEIREWPVYLAGLFLFLISGIALLLMPTPSFTTQIPWYSKPLDLLIGIVFLATLSIYLYKRKWRVSTFEHWLVLSLLIGVGAQVLIARSMRLYDWQFDTAHILLSLSYGCALIGLLANMYRLFQFAEKSRQELLKSATSLRQAHEEAQHAQMMQAREEQRFKLAVEGTGDGIWEWDLQTNQIWCSERFAHLLGYSSANALRRLTDFTRLIHPEDLHQWEQIRADVENAQRHDLEVRLRHRSQKYRWFQARGIVEIQDGEPVRMVGSIQDITELKRAMSFAALHGAVGVALAVTYPTRPMLQRCVEAMGQHLPIAQVAIWTLQEDEMLEMQARIGLVEQPETSLPRASWYDSDLGMIGQSAQPFHTNNIRESNMVPDRLTMLEEDIVAFAGFPLLVGDNSIGVMTACSKTPWDEETLSILTSLSIGIAVGIERVETVERLRVSEQRYREMAENLERSQESLQQASRDLERSNEDLDEFAYSVSHDLKQPMRGIKKLTEWLAQDLGDDLPTDSARHIEQIHQQVGRLENLLNDMLEYSRARRILDTADEVETGALIEHIIELLNPPEGMEIVMTTEMPTIVTVRVPLEQIFRNLIGNAIKHHHRETGRIEVSAHRVTESHVEFRVRDDGPGIDPVHHERVFRALQVLQSRDRVEGSGLGLAIVKKLIEGYGGTIRLESEQGKGSTFIFVWPDL